MELSMRDRDRISVLRQVSEGVLSAADGAVRFGVTERHFRRVRRRFEAEGDVVVVHGLRGSRSNRSLPSETRERVLAMARDPDYAGFGPTLLGEHAERVLEVHVSAETVRGWLVAEGLWARKRRRAKHRSRRPRRAARGELIQWDSSVHRWLEDRGPADLVLIALHDDATNGFMCGRFVERDTGAANRRAIVECLERHGRPKAVYVDRAGHFGQCFGPEGKPTRTIIGAALEKLGVEVILANSPQAKGRVERTFGTAQDRLITEMRLARIATIEAANRYLAEQWMPFRNERFAVAPAEPLDAHRPLPPDIDLEALFAETDTRVVARDFTVRFKNRFRQLTAQDAETTGVRPGSRVVVERRLSGELRFRHRDRYLAPEALGRPGRQRPRRSLRRRRPNPGPSCRSRDAITRGASTSARAPRRPRRHQHPAPQRSVVNTTHGMTARSLAQADNDGRRVGIRAHDACRRPAVRSTLHGRPRPQAHWNCEPSMQRRSSSAGPTPTVSASPVVTTLA